ncbi:hypothetical protein QYM36_008054 [Artemia franciscana]|uniref:HTH psq-type domain-containing protein n=1 Tax=Artemia franciscana TaxID=6661 RepID=A0AA88LKT1_ARTSF|nr:hypothetical protein QYM36_008054 [Artemia franciscana]
MEEFSDMEPGTIANESRNKHYPRKRRGWTEEDMREAIEAIKSGALSVSKACQDYNIPGSTMQLRLKTWKVKNTGRKLLKKKQISSTKAIDHEMEKILAQWILDLARTGFNIKNSELRETVQKCLKDNEEFFASANKFKDGLPSEGWVASATFDQAEKERQKFNSLVHGRDGWFSAVRSYLKEENKLQVLDNAGSVFCGEELSFEINPNTGEVNYPFQPNALARKGDREILTLFCVTCADGSQAPPMVVYPFETLPDEIGESMPEGWAVGCSGDGWIKSQTIF